MKTVKETQKNILLLILIFITSSLSAQDPKFTQVFSNPLKLNPAMMGINPDLKFILQYRNQWSGVEKGFTTYAFSVLYPLYIKNGKEKLDIGFTALNDKAGAFNNLDFSLALGYNLRISDASYLNFSFMGGYVQKAINTTNLSFDQQYILGTYSSNNPSNETRINKQVSYADVSFGSMWYYNPTKADGAKLNAYLGASVFHLNRPNESLTGGVAALPMRYSFQGGIKILGEGKIDFTPNIIFNSQNGNENLAAGLIMDYRFNEKSKLVLGAWYRKKDAIAFSLGCDLKTITFAYSYDVVNSQIKNSISGLNAHEITLSLKFNQSEKKGAKANASFF